MSNMGDDHRNIFLIKFKETFGFDFKKCHETMTFNSEDLETFFEFGLNVVELDLSVWIKSTDRLPTSEDADDTGLVYIFNSDNNCVTTGHWSMVDYFKHWAYWMVKPKIVLPKAPILKLHID